MQAGTITPSRARDAVVEGPQATESIPGGFTAATLSSYLRAAEQVAQGEAQGALEDLPSSMIPSRPHLAGASGTPPRWQVMLQLGTCTL
jgi:hypothetical protein